MRETVEETKMDEPISMVDFSKGGSILLNANALQSPVKSPPGHEEPTEASPQTEPEREVTHEDYVEEDEMEVEVFPELINHFIQSKSPSKRKAADWIYSCDQCEYKGLQSALYRHKKAKHGGMKYQCGQCAYESANPSHLKRHQEARHSGRGIYVVYFDHNLQFYV